MYFRLPLDSLVADGGIISCNLNLSAHIARLIGIVITANCVVNAVLPTTAQLSIHRRHRRLAPVNPSADAINLLCGVTSHQTNIRSCTDFDLLGLHHFPRSSSILLLSPIYIPFNRRFFSELSITFEWYNNEQRN